jgi:hypothetical protein
MLRTLSTSPPPQAPSELTLLRELVRFLRYLVTGRAGDRSLLASAESRPLGLMFAERSDG